MIFRKIFEFKKFKIITIKFKSDLQIYISIIYKKIFPKNILSFNLKTNESQTNLL